MWNDNSKFPNPHGLTERGHLSAARDIATIMQALDKYFVDYMHIFTRALSTTRTIQDSDHRLIKGYKEATAVKTGYTRAFGFSRAMIAEKSNNRIISWFLAARVQTREMSK
jgi:D-alanyl-D-alanine carboxypeptidase